MTDTLHGSAAALREEFDASFGTPPAARPGTVALLGIRLRGEPFAVRLLEAAGIVTLHQVVPVPSRRGELLGVAGLRGEVIPVFGLAQLVLGADDGEPPRWMILAGGPERVAFAFGTFESHLVVPATALRAPGRDGAPRPHAAELYAGPPPRIVLSLPSLVAAVTGAAPEIP